VARTRIAEIAQLPPGTATTVDAGGHTLALFNVDGVLYALDSTCPHRGGPLGEGDLDGTIVTCPWHAWRWDVTTGTNTNNPAVKVACFPVTIEGDAVFVEIGG
jgi:3-phenylpropionate/trans-cinnamate dioxygenase ferredoxin component